MSPIICHSADELYVAQKQSLLLVGYGIPPVAECHEKRFRNFWVSLCGSHPLSIVVRNVKLCPTHYLPVALGIKEHVMSPQTVYIMGNGCGPFFPPLHPFIYSTNAHSMLHDKDLLFLHVLKSSANRIPLNVVDWWPFYVVHITSDGRCMN